MKLKFKILITIYIIGIFLNYGYAYREEIKDNIRQYPTLSAEGCASPDAMVESFVWPVYLATHFSRQLWNGF